MPVASFSSKKVVPESVNVPRVKDIAPVGRHSKIYSVVNPHLGAKSVRCRYFVIMSTAPCDAGAKKRTTRLTAVNMYTV